MRCLADVIFTRLNQVRRLTDENFELHHKLTINREYFIKLKPLTTSYKLCEEPFITFTKYNWTLIENLSCFSRNTLTETHQFFAL